MRILKIESLPSTSEQSWVDRDQIMLHSCFQLLKDCVEKEKVIEDKNYDLNKEFVDECRFLYEWWLGRAGKDWSEKSHAEDDEMLIRLMKIRTGLWT